MCSFLRSESFALLYSFWIKNNLIKAVVSHGILDRCHFAVARNVMFLIRHYVWSLDDFVSGRLPFLNADVMTRYYSATVGERSIAINVSVGLSVCLCVCLSASISLEPLDRSSRKLLCRSPVAVARSSSGGVAISYTLPV